MGHIDSDQRLRDESQTAHSHEQKDRDFAITLAKGLQLLQCFTPESPTLSNAQLAELTGLSRPTVSRFVYTLCALGCLRQVPDNGRYRLGSAVLSFGHTVLATIGLRQVARPYMHQLADIVQGAVSMGVRDRLGIVYVDTCRSRLVTGTQLSDIGMKHPMLASSIGRAYLCGSDPKSRERLLNEIRIKTPEVWSRYSEQAFASIEQFATLGFCVSFGDIHPTRYAVGVPLSGEVDGEHIVFNCTLHSHQRTAQEIVSDIGPRLRHMVGQIESHVCPRLGTERR